MCLREFSVGEQDDVEGDLEHVKNDYHNEKRASIKDYIDALGHTKSAITGKWLELLPEVRTRLESQKYHSFLDHRTHHNARLIRRKLKGRYGS